MIKTAKNVRNQVMKIFEDDLLLAINKPSGLSVHKDQRNQNKSLLSCLESSEKLYVVHRLDKDTSGVMLLAKDIAMASHLSRLFATKQVKKVYRGIVQGHIKLDSGLIQLFLSNTEDWMNGSRFERVSVVGNDIPNGKLTTTEYSTIKRFYLTNEKQTTKSLIQELPCSLVEFYPLTGHKHQIRVHFSSIGHPILFDNKYGYDNRLKLEIPYDCGKRLFLHSYRISFLDSNGKKREFQADCPFG
jgi:23S rRNA pseudouridine955/2504/2580 synthase